MVDVSSFGGYVRQYEVSVDPARLAGAGVSMAELTRPCRPTTATPAAATSSAARSAFFIRGEGRATSLQDIGNIVVKPEAAGQGGAPLLVRDVAAVRFGHAVRYGAMTRNGLGETVGGMVLMLKGASLRSHHQEREGAGGRNPANPAQGPGNRPFLDRTKLVDKAIHTVVQKPD